MRRPKKVQPDFHQRRAAVVERALRAYLEQPTVEGSVLIERLQVSAERYDRAIARAHAERGQR